MPMRQKSGYRMIKFEGKYLGQGKLAKETLYTRLVSEFFWKTKVAFII
jgi:hypothetical protein